MSQETPLERAERQLSRSHWDGTGCGTHGVNACTYCFGPSPMTAAEVVEQVLTVAVEDREGLAEVIRVAQNVPFVGPRQYRIADAVTRWLTGGPDA